jgi:hypothetical protein
MNDRCCVSDRPDAVWGVPTFIDQPYLVTTADHKKGRESLQASIIHGLFHVCTVTCRNCLLAILVQKCIRQCDHCLELSLAW